jgi:hypothetical protein
VPMAVRAYLRREIAHLRRAVVVQRDGLDARQDDVLGCGPMVIITMCLPANTGMDQMLVAQHYTPISTPKPFKPTISTFDMLIFFMASAPSTYLQRGPN